MSPPPPLDARFGGGLGGTVAAIATLLGVIPLAIAGGAGADMRRTLGTAVFSGMIRVTLIGRLADRGAPAVAAPDRDLVLKVEPAGAHSGDGPGTADGARQDVASQSPPHAPA